MPRLLGRLGSAPTPAVMEAVFTRWEELVGAELGAHLRPQRVDGHVLVVAVEHPVWATRARMESGQILARLRDSGRDLHRPPGGRGRAVLTDTSVATAQTVQKCRIGAVVG